MTPCSSRSDSTFAVWSRRRSRFSGALSLACALAACHAGGPAFESVSTLPDTPRRPAGTDIDPKLDLPGSASNGSTAAGLVVLEGPADPGLARSVVAAFFRAVAEESPTALDALLTPQASIQSGSRREPVRSHFQTRFARLDYRGLSGEVIYREADLELWERGAPGSELRSTAPITPNERELVARVRVNALPAGRARLFGDELVFRLIPDGRGFRIGEIVEDFRVP
ncbi:MAG TPA: hypothetical protein VGK73_37495 [Polyangiaceae bacterium]